MLIKITEDNLREMVKDAITLIMESREAFWDECVVRIPYPILLSFTDHAIDRESMRYITERSVMNDVREAIPRILKDFNGRKLGHDQYFKVINRESCAVSVCTLKAYGKKINKIIVVTSYVWDGRMNIDTGFRYYIGDESPAYLEAKEWNAENQDLVIAYTEWKRNSDISRQKKKAEREYFYRNNFDIPPEKTMELVNKTYDKQARFDRKAIHNAMDPEELRAVQDYHKKMDRMPLASKGSANRDLRAMDLWKRRKESQD